MSLMNGLPNQLVAFEKSIGTSGLLMYSSSCSLIFSIIRDFSLLSIFMLLLALKIPISWFQKISVNTQLPQCQHDFKSSFLLKRHWPLPGMLYAWPSTLEIVKSFLLLLCISTSILSHTLFNWRVCWIFAASSRSHCWKFSALYWRILISFRDILAFSSSVKGFLRSSRSLLISMTRLACLGAMRNLSRQNALTSEFMPGFCAKWKQRSDLAWRSAATKPTRQKVFRPVQSKLIDYKFLLCLMTLPIASTTRSGMSLFFRWSNFS